MGSGKAMVGTLWIDEDFQFCEDLIGFNYVEPPKLMSWWVVCRIRCCVWVFVLITVLINVKMVLLTYFLVGSLQDAMLRMGLRTHNCLAQC